MVESVRRITSPSGGADAVAIVKSGITDQALHIQPHRDAAVGVPATEGKRRESTVMSKAGGAVQPGLRARVSVRRRARQITAASVASLSAFRDIDARKASPNNRRVLARMLSAALLGGEGGLGRVEVDGGRGLPAVSPGGR